MEEGNAWTVIGSYPEYITPPLCTQGIPACGVYRHQHQLQCGSNREVWSHQGAYPMVTSTLSIPLPSPARHFLSWEAKTRVQNARSELERQIYRVR